MSNGSVLVSSNEVNLRQARLVLRWVTVSGFRSWCRIFISVCNQPPTFTFTFTFTLGISFYRTSWLLLVRSLILLTRTHLRCTHSVVVDLGRLFVCCGMASR